MVEYTAGTSLCRACMSAHASYADTWSSGYVPDRDPSGGYLGWHAVMLLRANFSLRCQSPATTGSVDAWSAFLDEDRLSRNDGLWLADLTDPFPLDLARVSDIKMPESGDKRRTTRDDGRLLALCWASVMGS